MNESNVVRLIDWLVALSTRLSVGLLFSFALKKP